MATDETQGTDETEVAQLEVNADDLMKATEGNTVETENGPEVAQGTDTGDVPPEQVTPVAGGENVEVPSARGPAGPPTNDGNVGSGETAPQPAPSDVKPSEEEDQSGVEAAPNEGEKPSETAMNTPSNQLPQALPMTDESGSNIPAPNMVQPPAPGVLSDTPQASVGGLDPAIDGGAEAAAELHQGTINDAAVRADGVGSGDVEVATIPEYEGDQEYWPQLSVEDSVTLGEHELIPARLVGRRAFIVSAPRILIPIGEEDKVWITVKTRDEVSATLTIPLSAVEVERGNRPTTVRG